jgi:hypothetical protein
LILTPLVSGAQQVDLEAAAKAKAAAGREALSRPVPNRPGSKAVGTFVTFDAPGAVNGTNPASINSAAAITGSYLDANFVGHAFLRARDGTVIPFDVPGGTSTGASSINPAGTITGGYVYLNDPNFVGHGYLRTSNGSFATFDAPGAGTGLFQGTGATSINPDGTITGNFLDTNDVFHGFLRDKNGTITTFDAPGACTTTCFPFQGTFAASINPKGEILGVYTDANNVNHGFLRVSDGTFTTFDPPGQIFLFNPFSFGNNLRMNPAGAITGFYFQPISGNPFGGNYRVFVRAADGTFTTFDAADYPPCCIWSFPSGITPSGAITGSFNDGFTINHGFLRGRDGTLTTFDVPAAGNGFNQGTAPLGITPAGVVMGLYIDANYVNHGFLFLPF